MDKNRNFCALSIFNMQPNVIQIADSIIIDNPTKVDCKVDDAVIPIIRVDDPRQILINGNRLTAEHTLQVNMAVESSFFNKVDQPYHFAFRIATIKDTYVFIGNYNYRIDLNHQSGCNEYNVVSFASQFQKGAVHPAGNSSSAAR